MDIYIRTHSSTQHTARPLPGPRRTTPVPAPTAPWPSHPRLPAQTTPSPSPSPLRPSPVLSCSLPFSLLAPLGYSRPHWPQPRLSRLELVDQLRLHRPFRVQLPHRHQCLPRIQKKIGNPSALQSRGKRKTAMRLKGIRTGGKAHDSPRPKSGTPARPPS